MLEDSGRELLIQELKAGGASGTLACMRDSLHQIRSPVS